jgi:predicted RNase H-like HicB family nuclease
MKHPNFLQFIIEPDVDGGYTAYAVGYSIYTQGETVDETIANIREAVECHFSDDENSQESPFYQHIPILANVSIA